MSVEPTPPPIGSSTPFGIHVGCPHCRTAMTVPPTAAGSLWTCSACGGKFQVPVPMASQVTNEPYFPKSEKQQFIDKKVIAGICGIVVGGFGVHKFVLGFNTAGAIMLVIWLVCFTVGSCLVFPIVGCLAMSAIGLIEGIVYITKSDEEFYELYAVQKKDWF